MAKHTYRLAVLLALIGLVDAGYLTWLKWSGHLSACVGWGQCDIVNSSPYSELYGIPIALFGALAYAAILVLLFLEHRWHEQVRVLWPRYGMFVLTTAGVLYSAYLTYIELFVLEAICPFCVLSAIVLLGLWILAIIRLLRLPTPMP